MCINLIKTAIEEKIAEKIAELNKETKKQEIIAWLESQGFYYTTTPGCAPGFTFETKLGIFVKFRFDKCLLLLAIDWKDEAGEFQPEYVQEELKWEFSIFNFGEAEKEKIVKEILLAIENCQYIDD